MQKNPHLTLLAVSKFIWIFLILICMGWVVEARSQVLNDRIENRIELPIDAAPLTSTTAQCTVEPNCVDEKLTGKCIEYHNDQWFYFTTAAAGKYFLNIGNQHCRDARGVQMVVLSGTPCYTETYLVLSCTSLANQDNIFVALDSLPAQQTYLVNIDGYLHDFCSFTIQLSTKPAGIPVHPILTGLTATGRLIRNKVHLTWETPEELDEAILTYQVVRHYEPDPYSKVLQVIPHQRNTFGNSQVTYEYQDTLQIKGTYTYRVIAYTNATEPVLISEKMVHYDPFDPGKVNQEEFVVLKLDYKNNTPLTIQVVNEQTGSIVKKVDFTTTKQTRELKYFIGPLLEKGIRTIRIRITNNNTKQVEERRIELP